MVLHHPQMKASHDNNSVFTGAVKQRQTHVDSTNDVIGLYFSFIFEGQVPPSSIFLASCRSIFTGTKSMTEI